ncbi:MAG: hypothetical protein V4541_08795 [Bacteroidota bacterium]
MKNIKLIFASALIMMSTIGIVIASEPEEGGGTNKCIKCTAQQGTNTNQCVSYTDGSKSCPSYTTGTDCCGNKN